MCIRDSYVADHRGQLEPKLYAVPQEIDREVAMRKLTALGVSIDRLTDEQEAYLASWNV
jgi:adenosylhomocysteinase